MCLKLWLCASVSKMWQFGCIFWLKLNHWMLLVISWCRTLTKQKPWLNILHSASRMFKEIPLHLSFLFCHSAIGSQNWCLLRSWQLICWMQMIHLTNRILYYKPKHGTLIVSLAHWCFPERGRKIKLDSFSISLCGYQTCDPSVFGSGISRSPYVLPGKKKKRKDVS